VPKAVMGSDQIYWVLTVTTHDLGKFKTLVQKLVAATEKEPGALNYEYAVGDDQKTVDIFERYNNSRTAADHVAKLRSKLREGVPVVGKTRPLRRHAYR
jgi:quinol monooxygenase YgiN